ncbi:hypothetical protein Ahy_A06g029508 isoform B [Arachis hypogaea]|uniref:Uncharacterized protein n=1 Tax=Arachis hypogaea TaxID=3818 RepID=A0A445CTH6_ARAHY|nr:hypothetical protein Ahy_A06g029508 isoform B [Arachis hypogaea]
MHLGTSLSRPHRSPLISTAVVAERLVSWRGCRFFYNVGHRLGWVMHCWMMMAMMIWSLTSLLMTVAMILQRVIQVGLAVVLALGLNSTLRTFHLLTWMP